MSTFLATTRQMTEGEMNVLAGIVLGLCLIGASAVLLLSPAERRPRYTARHIARDGGVRRRSPAVPGSFAAGSGRDARPPASRGSSLGGGGVTRPPAFPGHISDGRVPATRSTRSSGEPSSVFPPDHLRRPVVDGNGLGSAAQAPVSGGSYPAYDLPEAYLSTGSEDR